MQSESKNATLDEKGMRKSTVVLRNAYVYARQVIVSLLIPNIIHHLSLHRNNNSYHLRSRNVHTERAEKDCEKEKKKKNRKKHKRSQWW